MQKNLGVLVERGPEELKDLPALFGERALNTILTQYEVHIFAEITDAPMLDVESILDIAREYQRNGAEVIDIFLPNHNFPHLARLFRNLSTTNFMSH